MKKKITHKSVHVIVGILKAYGAVVGFHFLPPWFKQNPGLQILAVTFVIESLLHAFLPEY